MQRTKTVTIAIALLLFLITAAYSYWAMTRTYALPSIDGPYYYIQVNSILRTGLIEYADPPLTFYVFTAFALAIGNVTTGVLVGSAVFAGLASVAAYLLVKHIFKEQIPAVAAGLVTALAAEHISMSVNVMKNGFGVVFIIGVIFFLQRCLDLEKHSKWNVAGVIGCFVLTLFSHVLDEGVALLFIGGYFLFSLLLKERKQLLKRYGPILVATAAIAVLAFVLVPSYFGDFNKGIIFVSDVTTQTTATAAQNFGPRGAVGAGWEVNNPWVILFLALGVGLTLYEWFKGDRKKAVLVGCASIIGIGLVLPFIPADFAWRFELMEFISVAVIVGYACAALTKLNKKGYAVLAMVVLLAPVAFVGYQTASSFSPTISSQQYSDLNQMVTQVSANNSVLFIQNGGMSAYWPEAILNLQAVTNASIWQAKGYNVYVLEGSQNAFLPGNGGNFGPPNGLGNQGPNVFQGGAPPNLQQGSGRSTDNISLANATLVYSGSAYSLYKLNS
jgi:hypothetical protein